jgi:hypothetical protein
MTQTTKHNIRPVGFQFKLPQCGGSHPTTFFKFFLCVCLHLYTLLAYSSCFCTFIDMLCFISVADYNTLKCEKMMLVTCACWAFANLMLIIFRSQFLKTIGTLRWQSCQPYAPAAFTPRKCCWCSFLLETELTPGS